MFTAVLLFLLGFALLIKGGDWFVDGSVGIAHRFHLPELLIGAKRMLEPYADSGKQLVYLYLAERIAEALRNSPAAGTAMIST